MQIISKAIQQTSLWSGGTTTELFIFPSDAEYAKRNFTFRISTATIETETSKFTSLPDYNRILMILKGEFRINHEGLYSKYLTPFETDTFDGAWNTFSMGSVATDFNILFAKNTNAKLTAHKVDHTTSFHFSSKETFLFGYLVSGQATLENGTTQQKIVPFDFIVFDTQKNYSLSTQTNCEWLLMEVYT